MRSKKFSVGPILALGPFFVSVVLITAVYGQQEDCSKASKLVKRGIDLSNGSSEEENAYRDAIIECPRMAEAHYNLGIVLLRRGLRGDAQKSFEEAVKLRDDSQFRLAYARSLLENNQVEVAETEYKKILEKDPKNADSLLGLSVIADSQGNISKAIEYLEKARAVDSNNSMVEFNLGVMHEKNGDLNNAIAAYLRASKINDANYEAHLYAGIAYQKQGDLENALRSLLKASRIKPDDPEAYRVLGLAYEKMGDLDKAQLMLEKAISLGGKEQQTVINLSVILIKKKQESLAEEKLKNLLATNELDSRGYSVLGWAQLELGKLPEAEKSLRKSLDLDGANASAHNNLGVLYQRQGNKEAAAREFESAVKLDPNLGSARRNLKQLIG